MRFCENFPEKIQPLLIDSTFPHKNFDEIPGEIDNLFAQQPLISQQPNFSSAPKPFIFMMTFKKRKSPIATSDPYYDLFEGGYINPSKILADSEDLTRVEEAIKIVRAFMQDAEDQGVIEVI